MTKKIKCGLRRVFLMWPIFMAIIVCFYFINLFERIDIHNSKITIDLVEEAVNVFDEYDKYAFIKHKYPNAKYPDCQIYSDLMNLEKRAEIKQSFLTSLKTTAKSEMLLELQAALGLFLLFIGIVNWLMIDRIKSARFIARRDIKKASK